MMTDQPTRQALRYLRQPDQDRRFARGDDFAGDAWLDTETGAIVYTVVGYDRNTGAKITTPIARQNDEQPQGVTC
jgi:hypothetical protein